MGLLLALVFSSCVFRLSSGSFSLFLPERRPQYTSNQQDSSSVYWPDTSQSQDYDEDGSYRYQQSYQSSYRQQIQSVPYTTSYTPNTLYQQLPPSSISTYQFADPAPLPPASSVLPGAIPTSSLPVYQIVTIGPEVPVLVRLPNRQTAILPVRTVYSLPGFLERIVERVQNYYSVYNPLEVLKIPRLNETEPASGESNNTTTPQAIKASSTASTSEATPKVSTLNVFEISPTTAETSEETTTDSNSISAESTTVE